MKYCMQKLNLSKESEKYDNLIECKNITTFPNENNKYISPKFSEYLHAIASTLFNIDFNLYNLNLRETRISISKTI